MASSGETRVGTEGAYLSEEEGMLPLASLPSNGVPGSGPVLPSPCFTTQLRLWDQFHLSASSLTAQRFLGVAVTHIHVQ